MLKVAKVGKGDIVCDLGSGDGRIPIAAVKDFGAARATGIDIDPAAHQGGHREPQKAGVGDRVRFLNQDLFTTNLSEATVVTLYLLPSLNLKLLPKLKAELKPGTRIVSHAFDMGDWVPEQTLDVDGRKGVATGRSRSGRIRQRCSGRASIAMCGPCAARRRLQGRARSIAHDTGRRRKEISARSSRPSGASVPANISTSPSSMTTQVP